MNNYQNARKLFYIIGSNKSVQIVSNDVWKNESNK